MRVAIYAYLFRRGAPPLFGNPGIHILLQHIERQGAIAEHHVMERPDIEAVAQLLARPLPQLHYSGHADLVGRSLAGQDDIALHLADIVTLGNGGVLREILDRLFAGPALGVDPGIDHEAPGPPDLHGEAAEIRIGILVEAHILAEAFGIKAPALRIGGEIGELAEHGY